MSAAPVAARDAQAGWALEGARAAYGLVELVAPGLLIQAVLHEQSDSRDRAVARVLGARHVLQAGATLAVGSPVAHAAGSVVDLLHALSMYGLAGLDRRRRRAALGSALVATSAAVLELTVAGKGITGSWARRP